MYLAIASSRGYRASSVLYRFGNILYTHYLSRIACHKVSYRTGAGVKVIHHLVGLFTLETGVTACNLVQIVSLRGISLIKRFGVDTETEAFHLLFYIIVAALGVYVKV